MRKFIDLIEIRVHFLDGLFKVFGHGGSFRLECRSEKVILDAPQLGGQINVLDLLERFQTARFAESRDPT